MCGSRTRAERWDVWDVKLSFISFWFDACCRFIDLEEDGLSLRGLCSCERISRGCLMSVQITVNHISPYCIHTEFWKLDHTRVVSLNVDHYYYMTLDRTTRPSLSCRSFFLFLCTFAPSLLFLRAKTHASPTQCSLLLLFECMHFRIVFYF